MKRLTFLMPAISALLLFSGCGQSGPLFVPGAPSQMAVPPSQTTADDDEIQQESSEDSSASE